MFKKDKILFNICLTLLFLLIIIPASFASDNSEDILNNNDFNETSYLSANLDDNILRASNDYYFNASAEDDGDGSINNPYKYLTADRIKSNCNIYLADGEYELDSNKNIERVNIYGSDVEKTIVSYAGVGFFVSTSLTIQNVTFVDMSITNYGKIAANNTVFSYGYGSRSDSYGNNFGGAIYTPSDYSNAVLTLNNCTFNDNYAVYGGAIYMASGSLEITDSLFINNLAYNYGGAIACENTASVVISKSKFYNSRSVDDAGGAIYLKYSSFEGKNIDFINCSATFGAAITSLKSTFSLNNGYFENNSAKWNGGAIYHMYDDFTMTSSKFINNSARNGGAVFIDNCTSLYLRANIFTANSASFVGGAVYSLLNIVKVPILGFNKFSDNQAYLSENLFDSSNINLTMGSGNYSMVKFNDSPIDAIPSRYSLYENGFTTVVKDQQTSGNCWAFTAISVLESCILKATGNTYDLSEENMKNLAALFSDYGWNMNTNDGGYDYMPWGYLASWLGPVSEMDDLFDDKSVLSSIFNSIFHVQNILFLSRDNYTDNDAIKEAILKYGAVGTSMAYYSNYYDDTTKGYYCFSNVASNHAVTIVGWDDNYSKSNFKWANYIEGDGAWIVRNSWGPSWGENGYFYVSYYDMKFAQPGVNASSYTIIFNDTKRYDKNYQYDIAGITDFFCNSSNAVWYKNIFTAGADEYLAAVSTYFEKITNWTASIYVNDEPVLVKKGISNPGYYTFDLGQLIPLKAGDVFEVVFNILVGGEANFPISEAISLNRMLYKPGISFVSYDGKQWQDLYDLEWAYSTHSYKSQVASIKAFTILNPIAVNTSLNVSYDGFNPVTLTAKVIDEYGNLLDGEVLFNINGEDHYVNASKGQAVLECDLNQTTNFISAKFIAPGYISSADYKSVEISVRQINLTSSISRVLNNVTIEVMANETLNITVSVVVNDDSYEIELINGQSSLNLSNLLNDVYTVTVYSAEQIYSSNIIEDSFTVDVRNTTISADDLTIYDSQLIYNITLTDSEGNLLSDKNIRFVINNETYNATTDNGIATLVLNLELGKYIVDIDFEGTNDYLKSNSSKTVIVKDIVEMNVSYEKYQDTAVVHVNISKPLNETLSVKINNNTQNITSINGIAILNLTSLENGKYDIEISIANENYFFNQTVIEFVIDVFDTVIAADDLICDDSNVVNYTVRLTDIKGNPLANKSVEFILNNDSYISLTDDNGEASILVNLTAGAYDVLANFNGEDNFFSSSEKSLISVHPKVDIALEVEKYQNKVSLNISLSKAINETLTVIVNDNKFNITSHNGLASMDLSNLDNGIYDIEIRLDNDSYVFEACKTSFEVNVSESKIILDNLTLTDDAEMNFTAILVDGKNQPISNKTLEFTLNNETYSIITDSNGKSSIPLNLPLGKYDVLVKFTGDDSYFDCESTSQIKVKSKVTVSLDVEKYQNTAKINVGLSKDIDGPVTVIVNGKRYDVNSILVLNSLENGIYNVSVELNDSYEFNNVYDQFTVDVCETIIVANDLTIVENQFAEFNITLMDVNGTAVSGRLIDIVVDGKTYGVETDLNGLCQIPVNLTNGLYDVHISFAGDDNYFNCSKNVSIKVRENVLIEMNINVETNNVYINISSSKTVNGTYVVKINDETFRFNTNGTSNIVLLNKTKGNYVVEVYLENEMDYNVNNLSDDFEVQAKQAFLKSDISQVYVGGFYKVTLSNSMGLPLSDSKIRFEFNGNSYTVNTDSNGEAYLRLNLTEGNYSINVYFAGDNYYDGANLTADFEVKSTILNNNTSDKTYNSKYTVIFLDSNGNPLNNSNVKFIINDKEYVATTDENGLASLQIQEGVGNYNLTIINLKTGETLIQSIKVSPRITNNKDMTIYALSGKKFTIRAYDDNGNPAGLGENIAVKIAGKTYTITTNANGYASLKINLINKKYTITATYKGFKVSNVLTVKPVLITVNKVFKKAKSYKFRAKLVNGNGKALKNKKITFKIKGKKYVAKTNKYGKATITIKLKLKVGSYKIYSIYGKSKIKNTIKIKK